MSGLEPADDALEIEAIHRGASGCRTGRVFPNVQEDARAVSFDDGIRVISNENSKLVRRTDLQHLLRAFPIENSDLVATDDLVVVMRIHIIDTLGGFT